MIAMKIMIVEDEENIRDGIRNLVDWNQEGFEEPLLFSSAVEALVFLETETVDVVLTDLYMPVLNGIEFIRMLREQNQVCEVIILTGHERFELAREAIALGVKQYLLKPVTGQTLLTELHKVSREIQERMRLKDWVDIAKKKLHDYLPVIQNQFWNDLLLGNLIELKKIKERAEEAEISIPESEMTCLAVQRKGEQLERDRITREMALRELTEEILGEKYLGALFYNGMEMVICKGRISRDYVEILNESVKHNFGYSISIGVSTAQKDATNLRNLAREAMDAVQSIHEEDVISYIYYRDIENKKKEKVKTKKIKQKKEVKNIKPTAKKRKSARRSTAEELEPQFEFKKHDKYSTKGFIFLHGQDKETAKQQSPHYALPDPEGQQKAINQRQQKQSSQVNTDNLLPLAPIVQTNSQIQENNQLYNLPPLDEIKAPALDGKGYSIHDFGDMAF